MSSTEGRIDERTWRIRVPGQPPSMNHLYRDTQQQARDAGGRPLSWPDGRPKYFRTKVKADGVQAYQDSVTWYTKVAVPKGWEPSGRVRLRYWFHLTRDIDCDNAMKALNDAVALGMKGNDKAFLPTVVAKWTGEKDPCVVIEVQNEEALPHEAGHHREPRSGADTGDRVDDRSGAPVPALG